MNKKVFWVSLVVALLAGIFIGRYLPMNTRFMANDDYTYSIVVYSPNDDTIAHDSDVSIHRISRNSNYITIYYTDHESDVKETAFIPANFFTTITKYQRGNNPRESGNMVAKEK